MNRETTNNFYCSDDSHLDKDRWLAEKVMNWEYAEIFPNEFSYRKKGYPLVNLICVNAKYWKPSENIEHAMMLLDQYKTYQINKVFIDYKVLLSGYETNDSNLPKAITEAVLKASGFYNKQSGDK